MQLVRYNTPVSPIFEQFGDILDIFDMLNPTTKPSYSFSAPRVHVENLDDRHVIEMATPGISKDDLIVDVDDGLLTISYESKDKDQQNSLQFQNSFKRSWTMPKDVDFENIDAKYENGVLSVSIPKSTPDTPPKRRISVA